MISFLLIMASAIGPDSVHYKIDNVDTGSIPFIVAYGSCFDDREKQWDDLDRPSRIKRIADCRAERPQILARAKNEFHRIEPGRQIQAERKLDRTFNQIERAYERAVGDKAAEK